MNIVLVTRFYPPDTGGGGIAAYAHSVAIGLVRRDHQVCVISCRAEKSNPIGVVDGIQVHRIPSALKSYRWTRLPVIGRHVRLVRDMVYAWRVRKTLLGLCEYFRVDMVEYADIDAEGIIHPPICPHVVRLHTPHVVLKPYYGRRETPYSTKGIEILEKHATRKAQGISAPSRFLAREIGKLWSLDARIEYVPNPVDTDFFSPCDIGQAEAPPIVLYVGRLEPRKGAIVFARAIPTIARAVPNALFVFAGADGASAAGGSQKAELEKYFENEGLGGRIQFVGHAAPNVFRDFYRRATVFAMPSLFENCPYTLLEAMACGKPVIASRAGGMPEMIRDRETGMLFEPGDSEALAQVTITLLGSAAQRTALGQAARDSVLKNYSLDVGATSTEEFYRKTLMHHRQDEGLACE